jgi:hypothetical protein
MVTSASATPAYPSRIHPDDRQEKQIEQIGQSVSGPDQRREAKTHSEREDEERKQRLAGPAPTWSRQEYERCGGRRNDCDDPECITDPAMAHGHKQLVRRQFAAEIQHPAIDK